LLFNGGTAKAIVLSIACLGLAGVAKKLKCILIATFFWFDCVSSALILEDFIYFYYKYHWYNK
jgi:hypothetical protein